jgi:hypothetical protein
MAQGGKNKGLPFPQESIMRTLVVILAVILVTACSGMRTSGSSSGNSGTSGTSDSDYRYGRFTNSGSSMINRHDDPRDLYFGG